MATRKRNLSLFGLLKRKPKTKARSKSRCASPSQWTVAQAIDNAYRAGRASGDTGSFDAWLCRVGLQGRSASLRKQLRAAYTAWAAESQSGSGSRSRSGLRLVHSSASAGTHRGIAIRKTQDGYTTDIDPESVHDTLRDAKRFIDSHMEQVRNPRNRSRLAAYLNLTRSRQYRESKPATQAAILTVYRRALG